MLSLMEFYFLFCQSGSAINPHVIKIVITDTYPMQLIMNKNKNALHNLRYQVWQYMFK